MNSAKDGRSRGSTGLFDEMPGRGTEVDGEGDELAR